MANKHESNKTPKKRIAIEDFPQVHWVAALAFFRCSGESLDPVHVKGQNLNDEACGGLELKKLKDVLKEC